MLVPDLTRKVTQMSTSSFSELRDPILMIFFVKKSRQLGLDENIFGEFFVSAWLCFFIVNIKSRHCEIGQNRFSLAVDPRCM